MKLTKGQKTKIIILLVIIIIFNFVFPIHSNAGHITGILTRPVCFLIVGITDGVNLILNSLFNSPGKTWNDFITSADSKETLLDGIRSGIYRGYISPDKIFSGEIELLNANIFTAPDTDETVIEYLLNDNGQSIASALKRVVSNIYIILRNLAAVILLCLLIYTGIRILLTSASPFEQSKWKQALIDWVEALCLLIFVHFLMIGIFYISDIIVDSLKGAMYGDLTIMEMIRCAYANNNVWDDSEAIVTTIMYVYITYLTILFLIAYFKRLIWIVILIVISPIVAITKALGQKQGQIFDKWLKEYIYTVLLQPFHMLIFFILVAVPLGMMNNNVGSVDFFSRFEFDNQTYAVYFYILVAISLIRPAEKFLYNLFGFSESSVAKEAGSSESGAKTLKAVEKVVKETVKMGVEIVGAVATGRSNCSSWSSWSSWSA